MAEATGGQIPATLIPGDGIGPEIVEATVTILDALGAPFAWDVQQGGMAAIEQGGDPLPRRHAGQHPPHAAGAQGPADDAGRRRLPLGRTCGCARSSSSTPTCARRARSIPGGRYENIDLVLVRENLEGLYVGFEHYIPIGDDPHAVAISSGRQHARRAAGGSFEFAFEYAVQNGRKKVTIVHKANMLKALTGIFLETGARGREGVQRPRRDRRPDRRRLRHAAGAEPVAVRHDRHDQPVRRHPLGPDGRPGRRARHGARRQHRRRRGDLRGGARLGARHRRARASPIRWRCCWQPR